MSLCFNTRIADWKEILPSWRDHLWPDNNEIKQMSSMEYMGGYDMQIYLKYDPTYFVVEPDASIDKVQKKIVGVNSGFRTSAEYYRSRGLWVEPIWRGWGLSQKLLTATIDQAKKEGCKYIWSIPRKSALRAYEKAGFVKTSDFFDEGMAYGPNCYVRMEL